MTAPTKFPVCGVTYVATLEHDYLHDKHLSVCANCLALGFQVALRRCTGCRLIDYSSKECQQQHWPRHKAFCRFVQGKGAPNAYLSSFPQDEVWRLVIDAYRLRVETDHSSREEDHGIYHGDGSSLDGLVWAKGDATQDFQRFLDLIEGTQVLPRWWNFDERIQCLSLAIDKDDTESIFHPLDQAELPTRYGGDMSIRVALLVLAELVVGYDGKGPAKDGTWYEEFKDFFDNHPEERARLIKASVDMADQVLKEHGEAIQSEPS